MTECQDYFSSPAADAADTACGDVLNYGVECSAECSKWISVSLAALTVLTCCALCNHFFRQ